MAMDADSDNEDADADSDTDNPDLANGDVKLLPKARRIEWFTNLRPISLLPPALPVVCFNTNTVCPHTFHL